MFVGPSRRPNLRLNYQFLRKGNVRVYKTIPGNTAYKVKRQYKLQNFPRVVATLSAPK